MERSEVDSCSSKLGRVYCAAVTMGPYMLVCSLQSKCLTSSGWVLGQEVGSAAEDVCCLQRYHCILCVQKYLVTAVNINLYLQVIPMICLTLMHYLLYELQKVMLKVLGTDVIALSGTEPARLPVLQVGGNSSLSNG